MIRATIGSLLILLQAAFPATAASTISVGNHLLRADRPAQPVPITVSGADQVVGMAVYAVIGDGGSELGGTDNGPVFEEAPPPVNPPTQNWSPFHPAMIDGSIWAADHEDGWIENPTPSQGSQWFAGSNFTASYYAGNFPNTVSLDGLLVTFLIDTTGYASGTWDLYLSDTPGTLLADPYGQQWVQTYFYDGNEPGDPLLPAVVDGQIKVGTLNSFADGAWNDPSSWDFDPLHPEANHDTVVGAHQITVAADGAAASLSIDDSLGRIAVNADRNLVVGETLSVSGTLEIGSDAAASAGTDATIAGSGALRIGVNGGQQGDGNGRLSAGGNVAIAGEVALIVEDRFADNAPNYDKPWGDYPLTVVEATGAGAISGTFAVKPAAGEHLGHGLFFQAMDYTDAKAAKALVFQAIPGDVNGDRSFDFQDLIAMFSQSGPDYGKNVGDKTWPIGDFTGDGNFMFDDLIAAFSNAGPSYGQPTYLGTTETEPPQDGELRLIYDQATGRLVLDTQGMELFALSIESAAGQLQVTPEAASLLHGFADLAGEDLLFKLDLTGMGDLDFGNVLATMLSHSDLTADLSVTAVPVTGGTIEDVGFVVNAVPEPGTVLMLLCGLAAWLLRRRR